DPASWVSRLFVWSRPRFDFSPAEQRTLVLALRGCRDSDIAQLSHVSISTVKKRWDSILERVVGIAPQVFSNTRTAHLPEGRRGPEKRRHLLQYLEFHREELRPYDPTPEG